MGAMTGESIPRVNRAKAVERMQMPEELDRSQHTLSFYRLCFGA